MANEGEKMFVYFLIALMGVQILKRFKNEPFSLEGLLAYLIPYWKEGDGEDKLLGILQIVIVSCISLIQAIKTVGLGEQLIIFTLTFVSLIWMIKTLIGVMEWLEEYLHIMTVNVIFTTGVPLIILLNMYQIQGPIEIKVCLIALLMSIVIVYTELISMILGTGSYKHMTKKILGNNGLKLKSILTWFFIILGNFYTLLLFIQFYMGERMHHFIEAERLTKESAVDLFYYLIVTFTTVGFGDIRPNTLMAKLVTALIALSGMLFTGIFVGSILTLEE